MSRIRQYGFFVLGVVAFLGVSLFPTTHWVVRGQLGALLGQGFPMFKSWQEHPETVRQKTEQYPYALAEALTTVRSTLPTDTETNRSPDITSLLQLQERFPNQPSLCAHLLRFLSVQAIALDYTEYSKLTGSPPEEEAKVKAEDLALFRKIALRGEKLDPNNAYFTAMRCVAELVANQEESALKTLQKAVQKPQWNTYTVEEGSATWEATKATYGNFSVLSYLAIHKSVELSHLPLLRNLSRVLVGVAIRKELAGNPTEGVIIRKNLSRLATKLRVEDSQILGNLVGVALNRIVVQRPGGSPTRRFAETLSDEDVFVAKAGDYVTYLKRIGEEKEAKRFAQEVEDGTKLIQLTKDYEQADVELPGLTTLGIAWALGGFILLNLFWVAVLGGIALLLERSGFAEPTQTDKQFNRFVGCLGWGIALSTIVGIVSLLALLVSVPFLNSYRLLLEGLGQSLSDRDLGRTVIRSARSTLSVPFGILCVAVIRSFFKKDPLKPVLIRTFRATALPMVGLLLLLFAVSTVVVGQKEEELLRRYTKMQGHEGRFYAMTLGRTWHEPVD
jgi:hypothetical protein